MKRLLFMAASTLLVVGLVMQITAFFILSVIVYIFIILEMFEAKREKSLYNWYKETKEKRVDAIEDLEYEEMDYNELHNN